jgi:signal transduction histidine kinase
MPDSPASARHRKRGLFAGLTSTGIAYLLLLCAVNGVRRSLPHDDFFEYFSNWTTIGEWIIATLQKTGGGMIIAMPVALAVVAAYNRAPPRAVVRYAVLALAVALSSLAGVVGHIVYDAALECGSAFMACVEQPVAGLVTNSWARYGTLCALFAVVFVYVRIADESAARAQAAELERERFVQRMEEARLRMLQAQIEPHFLFNTLANVRRLYQTTPADARTMLENLIRYFAVALPQMRAPNSTLHREAQLAESYLNVQRIRMGGRLTFEIDIPQALREARLPPMMLPTLVENAIKHGVAPLPEGGHVRVSAATDGSALEVRVADSGRGFVQSSGGGTGLANLRARLSGLFGAAGRLTLAHNTPQGIVATVSVPLDMSRRLEPAHG